MSRLIRQHRKGFTLLEVMIAVAILTFSLVVVLRIETAAVTGALRAQKLSMATDLAQEKMAEVQMRIEAEGMGTADVHERGDFDDYGAETRLDFDKALDDFEYEYWIEEVDFALSGDLMSMMGGGDEDSPMGGALGGAGSNANGDMMNQAMSGLGLGGDQLSEQLGQFIRRIRVRVYWGDEDTAEDKGREIILTTHLISPTGAFRSMGGDPNNPNAGSN